MNDLKGDPFRVGGVRVAAGGWVRMSGGFSHTSQGDCELIST